MQLRLLIPTENKNVFTDDKTGDYIEGIRVGDHPTEYPKQEVLKGNFLKDIACDIVVSQEVPWGDMIGYFYENKFDDDLIPDKVLVRFVRKQVSADLYKNARRSALN